MMIAVAIVIGYLLGSIPFAYIVGRLYKGIDIRQAGGGNVGALNTIREIGLIPGLVVLITDIAKGSVAVLISAWMGLPLAVMFIAGFASILGHNWPIFLKFKGGKGAATTIGVLLALAPLETAVSFMIMVIVTIITSNFRLAIACGLALLPLIIWQLNGSAMLIIYSLALSLFLILRSLPSFREAMAHTGRKSLIFDKERHFWQAKKNK